MKRGSRRIGRKWRLVLPCVFALSLALLFRAPGIFARYGTKNEGRTGARVASFEVDLQDAELLSDDSELRDPDDQAVYRVRFRNRSECRSHYEVRITNGSGMDVDWVINEPEGILEIGEEKELLVTLKLPAGTFLGLAGSTAVEGIRAEAVFTQEEPEERL